MSNNLPQMVKIMVEVPAEPGPAFLALTTDLQRNFVKEYCMLGEIDGAEAYRRAGGSSLEHAAQGAYSLMHNPKVLAAIREFAEARIVALGPWLTGKAIEVCNNPQHKDHGQMLRAMMSRAGLHEVIERRITAGETLPDLIEKLLQIAQKRGQHPRALMGDAFYRLPIAQQEAIEAEYSVVGPPLDDDIRALL